MDLNLCRNLTEKWLTTCNDIADLRLVQKQKIGCIFCFNPLFSEVVFLPAFR